MAIYNYMKRDMEHGQGIGHPLLAALLASAAITNWIFNAMHSISFTGMLGVLLLIISIFNQSYTMYKNFKNRKHNRK